MGQYLRKALDDFNRSYLDWELYLGPLLLSYNSGVSKSTQMSPFYATFGFDSCLPLWVGAENDLEPLANDMHADIIAKLHHTHRVARNIAYNNLQQARKSNVRNTDAPVKLQFKAGVKVWVKVYMKAVPNPKLTQEGEAGVVVERLSDSSCKVHRNNRQCKKRITLNITQIRPRSSMHPNDPVEPSDEVPEAQPEESDQKPETTNRRSSRLPVKGKVDYDDDIEFDADDADAILALVAEVKAVKAIEHLLPKAAHC